MLINRETITQHRPWIIGVVLLTALATGWYLLEAWASPTGRWPGGGSVPGLVLGTAGGVLILFEFLLWPRKWPRVRAWRIGRTQVWLRAHIWLGLLTGPLVILHHGLSFNWGGALTTAVMLLFWGVIASGVIGLILQQVIPRYLLERLPAESIASQLDELSRQLANDLEISLAEATGARANLVSDNPTAEPAGAPHRHLVVGAVRSVGRVRGRVVETRSVDKRVLDRLNASKLRSAFEQVVRPFLLSGRASGLPNLARSTQAATYFAALRAEVNEEAAPLVLAFEQACDTRRQFGRQRIAHLLLHGWIAVHLPLSVALVVLLAAHVVTALQYAGTWPI